MSSPLPRHRSSTEGRARSHSSWTRQVLLSRHSSCCCVHQCPDRPPLVSGSLLHTYWNTAEHTHVCQWGLRHMNTQRSLKNRKTTGKHLGTPDIVYDRCRYMTKVPYKLQKALLYVGRTNTHIIQADTLNLTQEDDLQLHSSKLFS